jgi:hypothetical protein
VFDDAAHRRGLFELPSVFIEPDATKALRSFVSIFCRFWVSHGRLFPKFSAIAVLDEELAQSLKQRSERRRHALTVLVGRMASGQDQAELVDVLFALTSFEMFDALSVRRRSDKAIEALIQQLVHDSVKRFCEERPRGGS